MASAPLWLSTRGRSIDSPSVRHTASLTEACWSTGPGISRGVQGAPLHHGVSRRWNELSPATRSMADIRASSRWVWRMEGGRREEEKKGSGRPEVITSTSLSEITAWCITCVPCCVVCVRGAQTEGNGMKNAVSAPFVSHIPLCSHGQAGVSRVLLFVNRHHSWQRFTTAAKLKDLHSAFGAFRRHFHS